MPEDHELHWAQTDERSALARRIARTEMFKVAILALGFIAFGFALGCLYMQSRGFACPAPWQSGWTI